MTAGSPEQAAETLAAPLRTSDPVRLGSYRLLGRLGQGGMGTVYLGRTAEDRLVAIKVIRADVADDPEFRIRFRREADSARRVARFCTAEVLDANPDAEEPYLVTEFIEGETLARSIATRGPLSAGNLERLAVGVAAALTAIHNAGIIHRDLKPSNVVLSSGGPRVIDFGIARALDSNTQLTSDLQQLGTPAFMAPEQIEGRPLTPAVDIFAWGGVVAYAGTGRQVFGEGPITALLYRAVHDAPDIEGLTDPLRSIVADALAKDPARRPTSQGLMLRLLGQPTEAITNAPPAVEEAGPAVTQVLSGWKLPETPPGGVAAPRGAGIGAPDWVGPAAAGTADDRPVAAGVEADRSEAPTSIAGRTAAPAAGGAPGPVTSDDTATELIGPGSVPAPTPAVPAPAPSAPAPPPAAGGGRPGRGRRWVLAGVGVVVLAAVAVGATLAFSGGGKDAIVLLAAKQPLSTADFVYGSDAGLSSIVAVQPEDGTGRTTNLVALAPGLNLLPILSPNRKTVVYFLPSDNSLRALASDGSTGRLPVFTTGEAATLKLADDARPSFTPNGKGIAIVATQGPAGAGLYIVNLKNAKVLKIVTPAGLVVGDPAVSPDGKSVIYWAAPKGQDGGQLFTSATDGTGQATSIVDGDNADPSWSPDGTQIVFRSNDDPGNKNEDILISDPTGTHAKRLTSNAAADQDPNFSPDGKHIVFDSERLGARQIFEMNLDGSDQHLITHDRFKDSVPAWSYH
jgi:eukaryotic-like serine/threonine-protein kinase